MIIVSELIIKLDEQPLSFSAAAAPAPHIFISTRWFREQIFAQYNTGEATERPQRRCLLFFRMKGVTLGYLRNAARRSRRRSMTHLFIFIAGVWHTKRYIIPLVNVGATKGCGFSLTSSPSKFIICRRASSCPQSTPSKVQKLLWSQLCGPKSWTFNCICGPIIEFLLLMWQVIEKKWRSDKASRRPA